MKFPSHLCCFFISKSKYKPQWEENRVRVGNIALDAIVSNNYSLSTVLNNIVSQCMTSRNLLDKFRRLNESITSISQFSHTGIGMEDRLTEPDIVIVNSKDEFTLYVDHVLKRIRQLQDQNSLVNAQRFNVEALKERVLTYPQFGDYVISFEYIKQFSTSPTYTVIIQNRFTGEVLSMTHVSL